ncbi:Hypothetical protein (Fragment), partial [Durusdinium trenchii]
RCASISFGFSARHGPRPLRNGRQDGLRRFGSQREDFHCDRLAGASAPTTVALRDLATWEQKLVYPRKLLLAAREAGRRTQTRRTRSAQIKKKEQLGQSSRKKSNEAQHAQATPAAPAAPAPEPSPTQAPEVKDTWPEDLSTWMNLVAFKERQQRVFLPVDDPPPPSKRPAAEDSRVSSSRESQRLNAWAQRFLKGLAEKASMDSSKTCQELSDILEAERVNMAEETYVALVELCVEAQNLPDASRLYSEMEAKGFKAQNDLTDQVIGLYSKTQAK